MVSIEACPGRTAMGWRSGIAPARDLLIHMAETLGADLESAADFATLTVPIAGAARNWNANPADTIIVTELTPGAYTLDALQTAFTRKDIRNANR